MIKITNGKHVIEVTNGAYEDIYKRKGYRPFESPIFADVEETEAVEEEITIEHEEMSEDAIFTKTFIETPMSNWTLDDTKRFVALHSVNITGVKGEDAIKKRVKAHIDSM